MREYNKVTESTYFHEDWAKEMRKRNATNLLCEKCEKKEDCILAM
jgi:hypothetical protein